MRDWKGKRYWLVGASEGLGRALAHQMSRAGVDLVLSARNADRLTELAGELPGRAETIPIDVADPASVKAAAQAAGEIDGMIFMAGVYKPMHATEWDAEAVTQMIDVNLTGAARVLGEIVPGCVARNHGHIVLIASLAGFRGLPKAVGYGASKAGLISLAETMKIDLAKTDIEVQCINPGFVRTRLTDQNTFSMPFIMEPEAAAAEMFEHMTGHHFQKSFPFLFALAFRLAQLLPFWAYFRLAR